MTPATIYRNPKTDMYEGHITDEDGTTVSTCTRETLHEVYNWMTEHNIDEHQVKLDLTVQDIRREQNEM